MVIAVSVYINKIDAEIEYRESEECTMIHVHTTEMEQGAVAFI